MTKYVGIIGYPLTHSVSPLFQQAAFNHHCLDVKYETWPTSLDLLEDRISSLRDDSVYGANVTVPHKETVVDLMDELDDHATMIGAVNTIVNHDGKLTGHNTDTYGLVTALTTVEGMEIAGQTVLLLGAGGAARAAVFGLLELNIAGLRIANRTMSRAEALLNDIPATGISVSSVPWEHVELSRAVEESAMVVNCTSVGMAHSGSEGLSPIPNELLRPGLLVFDMVYNPTLTPLLSDAEKSGARAIGGLSMLVHQGVASFELWTGKSAPVDVMTKAAYKAMADIEQDTRNEG